MEPLKREEILASFEEQEDLFVPDLAAVPWDVLDYYGWVHPVGHLGFLVLQSPNDGSIRGVRLRRSQRQSRKPRMEMCSWCHHVHRTNGTAMFTVSVRGSDGRHTLTRISNVPGVLYTGKQLTRTIAFGAHERVACSASRQTALMIICGDRSHNKDRRTSVADALPWHHVHLTQTDRTAVAAWYTKFIGARIGPGTKRSENLWFNSNLMQIQSDTAIKPPSTGEIAHIGIGVTDLDAAIGPILANGGTRTSNSLVVDPWGTPIQLVESDSLCFHHLMIVTSDPIKSSEWYALNIGGEIVPCPWDHELIAIQYDTMWLVFKGGRVEPGARPIDHFGWYTPNIQKTASKLLANGCQFPIPVRDFGQVQLAFVEDPSGLWVELVEPAGGRIFK